MAGGALSLVLNEFFLGQKCLAGILLAKECYKVKVRNVYIARLKPGSPASTFIIMFMLFFYPPI